MYQQTQLNIGLFGFGVVGESLWKVLEQNKSLGAQVSKVCIRHAEKVRQAPAHLFTTQASDLLDNPNINVIVELIDDADAAYTIAATALQRGKAVVSANKRMIANHISELLELQKITGASLLSEAACCASIPVIRNLEEYYDNDLLQSVTGIVNGSTNFILSRIADDHLDFTTALRLAQDAGYAESDPSLDIEGKDAVNKLAIILLHAYGIVADPTLLVHGGIDHIHAQDAAYAREKGLRIKLVATAAKVQEGGVAAMVLPQFVRPDNRLFPVKDEYNGLVIESTLADRQFFSGKGAGGFPTASAVISDISALRYNYRYEYRKRVGPLPIELTEDVSLAVYLSFDTGAAVPQEFFDDITEWASNEQRTSITGTTTLKKLAAGNWWKQGSYSLILQPDGLLPEAVPVHNRLRSRGLPVFV